MLLRSRIGAIAIAMLVTATGGSAVFGSSKSETSSQPKRFELSKFAGTWTGPIVQTGHPDGSFKAVLDTSGNGTVDIIELQCHGTETFVSFDGTTLKLRHVVTVDPLAHCVTQGTVTATLTGSNTSTWNFLGDDGTISTGTGTRAKKQGADHSCDRADAKVVDLVDHQAETDTKIGKQNKQLNVLTALKTRAVTAERQALVASTDKRILKLQENIDAKKSSIESDRSDEHALEEHCGITPPPPGGGISTFSATQTIPVPPASAFAGSAGGDGWALAFTDANVYNIFHHSATLTVACHHQNDAAECWSPKTITDTTPGANFGSNFAAPSLASLSLERPTGHIYAYATRVSDNTGGVICIDTNAAPTELNPYCGFTPLTAAGEAPTPISPAGTQSAISQIASVGSRLYAVNFVQSATDDGTKNHLLCFDLSTHAACAGQPYSLGLGGAFFASSVYPPPAAVTVGNRVYVEMPSIKYDPVTLLLSNFDQFACFDGPTGAHCPGAWPAILPHIWDVPGHVGYGSPFPMMDASGTIIGVCIPSPGIPCFKLDGTPSVASPAMIAGIQAAPDAAFSGPPVTIGARVYIADINIASVECFDYHTGAICPFFPKQFLPPGLNLLYTVAVDPQRPSCIWVNSDNGTSQIQNFDAFTGGTCGDGPIRILASALTAPTTPCAPVSYISLQMVSPVFAPGESATVAFMDGSGAPIAGIADRPMDSTGTLSLAGLSLNGVVGQPQFLITLNGVTARPTAVTFTLTWTGATNPTCVIAVVPPNLKPHLDHEEAPRVP